MAVQSEVGERDLGDFMQGEMAEICHTGQVGSAALVSRVVSPVGSGSISRFDLVSKPPPARRAR